MLRTEVTVSSPERILFSRANGARSRGPTSAAGKRRASLNALSHSLLARATVLENESLAGFEEIFRDHIAQIAPRNGIEQGALELELAAQDSPDQLERVVLAFDSLAQNRPHCLLLHRYETRLRNIIQRSMNRIIGLRKSGVPNEPGHVVEITPQGRL